MLCAAASWSALVRVGRMHCAHARACSFGSLGAQSNEQLRRRRQKEVAHEARAQIPLANKALQRLVVDQSAN